MWQGTSRRPGEATTSEHGVQRQRGLPSEGRVTSVRASL